MDETFKDWIPAGEDTGAITDDGFQDYVPAPEPKPQVIQEPVIETPEPVITEQPVVPPLESEGDANGSA